MMEDEREKEEKKPFLMKEGITVNNLSFQYNSELPMILDNTSFYIKKGEWIGIVGESGAGKSTLFQLLVRFYDAVSGTICIDNVPMDTIAKKDIRKNIALVS